MSRIGNQPASRGEILAWCFYDFANSSFTTLIVTLAYSVYFRQVVVAQGNRGDRWAYRFTTVGSL